MLKKHMAACLVATLFAAPAFAQTSTTAPAGAPNAPAPAMKTVPANPPAAGSSMNSAAPMNSTSGTTAAPVVKPAPMSGNMAQSGAATGQFVTQLQGNQMLASDLIGTKVISANNESIGDINDVIVDRSGQAIAAVVGVGGFLGIGEKDVAVPFDSLEFASKAQVNAMKDNGVVNKAGTTVTTTGATATNNTMNNNVNNNVNATGSTTMAAGTSASAADNEPERVILRMTKADLQAAPKFDKDGHNTATGTASPKK